MKLVFLSLLIMTGYCHAQTGYKNKLFDSLSFKRQLLTLSSDEFQGRHPFTLGESKTIAFLTSELTKLKLQPGNGNSYLQEVPLIQSKCFPASSISIVSSSAAEQLELGKDYAINATGTDTFLKLNNTPVVFVGYGIVSPAFGRNDYAGMDVKGKVVLVLMNERLQKESFFGKGLLPTYLETPFYKMEEAARHGAKACFLIQPSGIVAPLNKVHGMINEDNSMSVASLGRPAITGVISRAAARLLLTIANMDSMVIDKAAGKSFCSAALGIGFSTSIRVEGKVQNSHNVIAIIPGVKEPGEYVVYSAHWDHLGIGKPDSHGDSIYNGASDNAMGVAALLQLAKAFTLQKRPDRTVVFLFLTGEEMGFLGSSWYIAHPLFPLAKTIADINIDGFNRFGRTKDIVLNGAGRTDMEDLLVQIANKNKKKVRFDTEPQEGFYYRSDQISFAKAGIPALFLMRGDQYLEGGEEYEKTVLAKYMAYHAPNDEYNAGWRFDGSIEDLQLYYELGKKLLSMDTWPKWKKTSEFHR